MLKRLEQYCADRYVHLDLDVQLDCVRAGIGEKEYEVLSEKVRLFNEDMEFLPQLNLIVDEDGVQFDGWLFEFGGRFYLHDMNEGKVLFNELENVGKPVQTLPIKSFLGIHSAFETLSGMGNYKAWVAKAKFLGIKTLGILEKGTLAGVIAFQTECDRAKIKSVIGMTVPIIDREGREFDVKLYVKDFMGWQNLLKLNAKLNIEHEASVHTDYLDEHKGGLVIVFDPKSTPFRAVGNSGGYYQLDTVNFLDESRNESYMQNLQKFMQSDMSPVAITDAYYIHPNEWETREYIWSMGKKFDEKTDNQYFKNSNDYAMELKDMFEAGSETWINFYKKAKLNAEVISGECNFHYDTASRHLPKYVMTEAEAELYDDNEHMFNTLLHEALSNYNIDGDEEVYWDRLKEEVEVLKAGDTIDYFLVQRDIMIFAKSQNILTGLGRGSAAGSLVGFLFGITRIDPITNGLIFARFLNKGRMGNWEECRAFEIGYMGKTITLNEGTLVRVKRDGIEQPVFVEDLLKTDLIVRI